MSALERHLIRQATKEEAKVDCCGDRYSCDVTHVCSCGLHGCGSCISRHLFTLHWDVKAEAEAAQAELEKSAKAKLAAITPEERKVLGI